MTASKISATTKFPPRYAGMEVNRVGRIGFEFRFPRATRGWKDKRFIKRQIRYVSPALRGDGRISGESDPYSLMFPPRYAGMEGLVPRRRSRRMGFPRATRGWKAEPGGPDVGILVSPALRGDGRACRVENARLLAFT